MSYKEQVQVALQVIQQRFQQTPKVAVVLGSGLGAFADSLENSVVINYSDIPNWPRSTAPGHAGRLVCGFLAGTPVVAMQGRLHYYEGYAMKDVTFPVRVFGTWGVQSIIITNASGGISYSYKPGDLVFMTDHINFMGTNPLIGSNEDIWGPRFPDMTHLYSQRLIALGERAALDLKIQTRRGVYMAFSGPSYETPAEIRMARSLGADVVGMSTVPEAIVARHMSMEVCGISCVANAAAGMTGNALSEQEVLDQMARTASSLTDLLTAMVQRLGDSAATR